MTSQTTLDQFIEFSDRLTDSLSQRQDVIGLVLVGSTADHSRVDEWSDHDFFVITKEGSAEAMRRDLSWLPDHEQIVMSPRETDHGLKVVYRNAHVLEFAVFNDSELELAGLNAYSVAIDRANITERSGAIAARTPDSAFDFEKEWQLFLALLLIGVGRCRRAETLIAGQFVRSYCLGHVLGFVRHWLAPVAGTEHKEDSFNRYRRFEQQFPELGQRLEDILQLPVESGARAMLEFCLEVGSDKLTAAQVETAALVSQRFGWVD